MVAQKGSLVLLQVGDGASTENFVTVGGLRVTSFTQNNQLVEYSNINSVQTIGSYLILAYAVISFGLIFWGHKQQTLYDRIANTFVIRADELGLLQATIKKIGKWFKFLRNAGHSD